MINQQNDVHIQSKALPKDGPTTYLNTKIVFVIFCLLDYSCFVNFLFCLFNMSDSYEQLEGNNKTFVENLKKRIRESKGKFHLINLICINVLSISGYIFSK